MAEELLFENLAKPVVLTGSQLPLVNVRSDGRRNLISALHIAGYKATGLPCIPEVVLCFGEKILRGCRSTKMSSSAFDGFDSPNYPPLGRIGEHITIDRWLLRERPAPGRSFKVLSDVTRIEEAVYEIGVFPGFKPEWLGIVLKREEVSGVVLRTFGAGNTPESREFLEIFEQSVEPLGGACEPRKLVVNATRSPHGMVEMGLYSSSNKLLERGVVSGLDLTDEAALTKLYWALGTVSKDSQFTQLQIDQRGEQSQNLFDLRFGGSGGEFVEHAAISDRPDGLFVLRDLERAVVRVSGVEFKNSEANRELRVFLNQPLANQTTYNEREFCIATFSGVDEEQGPWNFVLDVDLTS